MIDVLISGSTGTIGKSILPNLQSKDFHVVPINLRTPSSSQISLYKHNKSFFLHLASQNSNMQSKDINAELDLLINAVEVAQRNRIQNFIFFSTSKLYPATNDLNLANEESEISCNDPYLVGKNKCESYLQEKLNCFQSITILRLAPVSARSQSSNMNLLFKFCEFLPVIPFFPSGDNNKRSFLSIINIVNFLDVLFKTNSNGLQVFNLCDNQPLSTNEFIESFLKKYRAKAFRLSIPSYIERLVLSLPFFGNKLKSLFTNNVIDNKKINSSFPNLKLFHSDKAMELYGLGDE